MLDNSLLEKMIKNQRGSIITNHYREFVIQSRSE